MKYKELGKSGIEASVIGLGTGAIGGFYWGGSDDNKSIKAILAAIGAGINLIDTAPVYGFGHSEEIVGKSLKGRRDKVVLATKCGMIWHKEEGKFFYDSGKIDSTFKGMKVYTSLSPENIRYEVEKSLIRLGTDYIDLYQTHCPDITTPIADVMETLIKLKEEGKIRAIGCSNVTPGQMGEYRSVGQLDVNQDIYSMLERKHEKDNLQYCKDNNISYLAYSPLGSGLLTGKIGPERLFGEGDHRNENPQFSVENRKKIAEMLEIFQPISEKHKITLGQLALAWTAAQPGCSHVLAGARTVEQAEENAIAGCVELSGGELNKMHNAIENKLLK